MQDQFGKDKVVGGGTIQLRYAYLCQRGYYPEDLYKANQDAFKVVPKFNNDQEQILFGVFDGHGVYQRASSRRPDSAFP